MRQFEKGCRVLLGCIYKQNLQTISLRIEDFIRGICGMQTSERICAYSCVVVCRCIACDGITKMIARSIGIGGFHANKNIKCNAWAIFGRRGFAGI
jgi:hypothetical protein